MKKSMKHTLLVAVLVICLFAVSMVAASASTFTGSTTASGSEVASITSGGTTYYYDTFAAAYADARVNSPAEIVVLKSVTAEADPLGASDFDITVKGANADVVLTMPAKTFTITGDATLSFEGLKLAMTGDSIYLPENGILEVNVNFTNTVLQLASNYSMECYGCTPIVNLTLVNSEIDHAKTDAGVYFAYLPKAEVVCVASGLKMDASILKGDSNTNVDLTIADITNVTNVPLLAGEAGTYYVIVAQGYGNDATAKLNGYTHRVGDAEGGKVGEVYFTNEVEALAQAAAGVKVYDITGATPVEVVKTCEHTFTDEVVAPTCTEEGYTKHTCSLCQATYNDTPVAATGHDYAAATCTKKATCTVCNAETGELARHKYGVATCTKKAACSVCGAERGELAKHVDADANGKCDKCEADMTAEETTAPATEEKKGCGGTVGVAGLALVAALGSCALFVEKKRK